jgi:hypothetical protein
MQGKEMLGKVRRVLELEQTPLRSAALVLVVGDGRCTPIQCLVFRDPAEPRIWFGRTAFRAFAPSLH